MIKQRKLKSVKTWVVIWAMILFTYIIIRDKEVTKEVYYVLGTIILGYMGCNVWQKKLIEKDNENENN